MSKQESKCMYCGSASYGGGCIFSAKHIHVHVDDPSKCIYCGSSGYGSGCIFNPFNHMHVHGMDVGQDIRESARKTVEICYIADRLFEKIQDNEAYKLKLIDASGNIIRTPTSVYEQRLISPLSMLVHKLKTYFVNTSTIVLESLKLISSSKRYKEDIEEYKNKLKFESELKHIVTELRNTIKAGCRDLSIESIENSIETVILDSFNEK